MVSQVKLIAEPWDVGEGGYQVGGFPPLWTEWNGKLPRHRPRLLARRAGRPSGSSRSRFTGSSDLYEADNRRPIASINFVTAHDGFTLHDLVSYNDKHNEANGEDNRDGDSHNRSWNHGVEGPTDDPEVHALRERQKRNFLTTLMLSQGVPMLAHGDELGRTQAGNNNVYAQDNELSWIDWDDARDHDVLTEFTARLTALRAAHPVFRRQRFFQGRPIHGSSIDDIAWLRPDGQHMTERGLDRRAHHQPRDLPQRPRHPRPRPARRTDHRRLLPPVDQRPPPRTHLHPARRRLRSRSGRSSSTPPTRCSPTPVADHPNPATACAYPPARCWSCTASTEPGHPPSAPRPSSAGAPDRPASSATWAHHVPTVAVHVAGSPPLESVRPVARSPDRHIKEDPCPREP